MNEGRCTVGDLVCDRIAQTLRRSAVHDPFGYEALAYLKLPGPNHLYWLDMLHQRGIRKYVEIGVRRGESLMRAQPSAELIAIDKDPEVIKVAAAIAAVRRASPCKITAFAGTSDEYFASDRSNKCDGFDLAFIDGDHNAEQALRDFDNLEAYAQPRSIIAFHDVIPMDERTSQPECRTRFWTGDVWRVMAGVVKHRPDLHAFTIACPLTGLGIVSGFGHGRAGSNQGWLESALSVPFPSSWSDWTRLLNIVPNDPKLVPAPWPAYAPVMDKKDAAHD